MNNVLVVENFSAGRKHAIKYKKRIHKFLFKKNLNFQFVNIEKLNEVEADKFDTIFVVGGDGTVNKVLSYLNNTNKTLGIIPSGTANLLASKLGINNISQALKAIDEENIESVDLIKINDKLSILRLGLGYDADIICKTPQSLKNKFGYFSYFIAGIIFALRLKKKSYSLLLNNEEINTDASCIIAANSANMYKNIVSVAKDSKLNDGLFDVFILKTTNPVIFFFELVKMFFGVKQNSKTAEYIKTSDLTIKNNNIITAHIDGEKVKFSNDIKLEVLNKRVKIFKNHKK